MIFKGNEYKKRKTHTIIRNDHGRRFMSNFDGILTNTNRYHVQISLAMYVDAIVDFIRLVDVQKHTKRYKQPDTRVLRTF